MYNKQYQILCVKSLTGKITDSEKLLLENWLADSEKNKKAFDKIKTIWQKTEAPKIDTIPNKDIEWNLLSNKLDLNSNKVEEEAGQISKVKSFSKFLFTPKLRPVYYSAFAAVILIAVIFIFNFEQTQPEWKSISTGNQESYELTLSDGSIVKLNSGSSIEYLENFESESREVKLRGEAFFSVSKSDKPFVVVTNNAATTVLGTQFNVWTRSEKTKVIVKEGKVKLASLKDEKSGVILTANNSASVIKNQNPDEPEIVDSEYLLGWMDGRLVFSKSSLSEVAEELERQYDLMIEIENDSLSAISMTGTFENEKIEDVLSMIVLTLNISYEKQGDGYYLKSKI
jgi:ferric-dicitrate binding protein FerR (iron transport regulator)